uniref:Ycf2 n=1 Tax=Gastrodia angusta TaxID=2939659 RepID=A0A976UF78_9ASPA|nr:hypothetical protein RF2 [Gastrodia angusta]UVG40845.1 hypothetical protein RF2 [Gastrodia angusta]
MERNKKKYCIFELIEMIEIHNYRYLLNSWTNYNLVGFLAKNFLQQEPFMKLFYFRNWNRIFFSRDSKSSKNRSYLVIKIIKSSLLFLLMVILLSRIQNRMIIKKKNIYFINILPIFLNYFSCKSIKDSLEESFCSYKYKRNNLKDKEVTLLPIPIKKKYISEIEFCRGLKWWRYGVVKVRRRSLSGHIFQSKRIFSEILFSLRNKDIKGIEFIFISYIDDLRYKENNLPFYYYYKKIFLNFNLEQLLEILGKKSVCYLMPAFYKKEVTIKRDKSFFQQQITKFWLNNLLLKKKYIVLFDKLNWKILSNIKEDYTSMRIRIPNKKQKEKYYYDKFIDIHNSFMNKNYEYSTRIYHTKLNKKSEKLIIWNTSFIKKEITEKESDPFNFKTFYLDRIFLEIYKRFFMKSPLEGFILNITRSIYSFLDNLYNIDNIISDLYIGSKLLNKFYRNVEHKEIGEVFKIIIYLKKEILNNMNFDLGMRSKFIGNEQIKMSSTLFYNLVNSEYILLQKRLDLFTLSITNPFLIYHMYRKYVIFSIHPYLYIYRFLKRLDTSFLLKKKLVHIVHIYYKTNIINIYKYIINLLKLRYRQFFIINRSNLIFKFKYLINKEYQRGINKSINNLTNSLTIIRYIRNKHLSNFKNKKDNKNWFDPIISQTNQTDIYINRNFYSCKKVDGINNLYNHLFFDHNNILRKLVKIVVNLLRINQARFKAKYFYELFFLFFYKSINYLFINIGNIYIHRSKIHIYIKKSMNNRFILKYMYFKINRLIKKKLKNKKEYYAKNNSPFSIIFHDQYDQDDFLETLNKISLMTYFVKSNRNIFFKNTNNLWFYHKKVLLLPKKKPSIHTYNYIYVNFLDSFILSVCKNKNIFSVSVGKKESSFLNRKILLPLKLRFFDISIIDNNLLKSGYKYKLNNSYNYLHFTNRSDDPFLRESINLLEYSSATYLKEEQIFILEKDNCKSISDRNISHFERNAISKYLILNLYSRMGLKYTSFFINNLLLPFFKNKKEQNHVICNNKYIENCKIPINFNRDKMILKRISYISRSRWDKLQAYMPCLFTLTGWTYIKSIILDSISEILLSIIQNIIYILYDTTSISNTFKFITHKLIINIQHILQHILINDTFNKILQNIILSEKYINRKIVNRKLVLSHLVSKNTGELFYFIYLFFFISGYIIFTQLLFFYQSSYELQNELEKIKSLIIPSYIMEFKKILYRYPIYKYRSELKNLSLNYFFLIITEQVENFFFCIRMLFRGDNKLRKYCNNFFVNIIPNPINRILFLKNTIFLSKKSKDLFYLINKRKNIKKDWIDDKLEIWVANNSISIFDEEERKFLVQFLTLKKDKNFLSGLTQSDHELLSKNRFSYQISEQPGVISLHYLLDMHQRDLITYRFKKYILLERHIFFSYFHKITYSKISCGFNRSNEKPFSIRLSLSYKGVLVIGSIGTGRSSLIKYLTKNPYVPLITIFISKFLGYKQKPTKFFDYFYNHADSVEDTDELDIKMLTMYTTSNLDQLGLILQFELAKEMSPCIIWIPNIHYLQMSELNYFYLGIGILDNYLFGVEDFERSSSIEKILVIASTHIPQRVDPALIAINRLNICIKIRGLIGSQQRKQFLIISYTRGFYFENKMLQAKNINTGYFAMSDLVTLSDEVLSLSITQNNSKIEINTIISASHIRNYNYISQIRSIKNNGILLYQIGRAFIKNLFIRDCLLDPISIYMKNKSCIRWNYYLYKWYFEFGTSIKRLTILFYIFSCSAGLVAKDLWSLHEEDNQIISYEFVDNEFYIVKGLLQLEMDGSMYMPECLGEFSKFYNNKITLFNRLKSKDCREWFDMRKRGYFSIFYNQFIEKNYELEFYKNEEKVISLLQFEEDFVPSIVWSPRIVRLCDNIFDCIEKRSELYLPSWNKNFYYYYYKGNDLQEKDLRLKIFESFHYQLRTKYKFSSENLKGLVASQNKFPASTSKRWFRNKKQKEHLDFLIYNLYNQRFIIRNRFFYISYTLTLSESCQYLLNMFLYNTKLFYQLRKELLKKKWIFSDEMNSLISVK